MALAVYIDDSGKNDPPVFVLAGFIAETNKWKVFSREWNTELSQYPAIKYLKMKEAHALNGQFQGISEIARDHKISRLASLCEKHLPFEIAAVVRHDDYRAEFTNRYAPRMDDPYLFMMMMLYGIAFAWAEGAGKKGETIDFIFDRQLKKEGVVKEMFEEFAKAPLPLTAPMGHPRAPSFGDDKTTPALQAADMLAWHIRRHFADREAGATKTLSVGNEFFRKPDRSKIDVWSADRLRNTIEKLTAFSNDQGNLTPYQALKSLKRIDLMISRINEENLKSRADEESALPIPLWSIQASQMKRFLLVHRCPNADSPHLHRRASGFCLSAV